MLHTSIAVWKHYISLNFKIIEKNVIWWSLYTAIVSNHPKSDPKIIYSFIAVVNDVAQNFQILLLTKTLHFHKLFFDISEECLSSSPKNERYSLREKCPIQSYFRSAFSRIRTEYAEILSLSAGKYGPEITLYLDTFHAVIADDHNELFFVVWLTDERRLTSGRDHC